jgi:uncharacterized protein YaaN involved in tellurite resistance
MPSDGAASRAAVPARSDASLLRLGLDTGLDAELEQVEAEATALAAVREQASERVDALMSIDPGAHAARDAARAEVAELGRDLQHLAATRSRMLSAPLREMTHGTDDGGDVATSLADLRTEVERLDPSGLDTSAGWFTKLVGKIPGVGSPLQRYFLRYESSQTQIDAIVRALEGGRDQLKRDNITLIDDQRSMRASTSTLADQIGQAEALDVAISHRLANQIAADHPQREFLESDILVTLRQRTLDLQQQLAVNQQGVLATEIVIRNNRELIRGVDRSIDVTVNALQVAVTVAMALAHQRIVLDQIEAINSTTSAMIAGTARQLGMHGAAIHERAVDARLDMDALRVAFAEVGGVLDEITRYRREALPAMASQIVDLDHLIAANGEQLERMEGTR